MESNSLKLAYSHKKNAEKASKSGLFSKAEWDIAAPSWDRAADAFKIARHYEEAMDCYKNASEAYMKINLIYLAGKGYENAASLSEKHFRDHARTIAYYCRASDLFRSHGSSADKAAEMMEKAAHICEDIDTNRAIQLYKNTLAIYESEDRARFSVATFKKLIVYLIRQNRLSEAADTQIRLGDVCQQINSRIELNKSYLSAIVILLAFGDVVEAGKKRDEFGKNMTFVRSNEGTVANAMVQAYSDRDQDQFNTLVKDQTTTFLESAIVRLAAQIRVPGAGRARPDSNMATGAGSSSAFKTAYVEEDEDADLL
ncbi:hypothetical protein H4S08_000177 [Coemansia sp. RSA 1365]|nr:hypothetical protein H4S08_000177 [Coemansia sp. RSA 1365]